MIKCRDEFGLLINNKPTRKRAAEKCMLQPSTATEPPTDDEEDEVSSPPKKRVRKKCSVEGCTINSKKVGVCHRHGAKGKRIDIVTRPAALRSS